jgi:hypothetical protein
VLVYPFEGSINVASADASRSIPAQTAVALSPGEQIELSAGPQGVRLLVLAGRPLREPIVQYGPFVMNTREEIEQAIRDYQSGEFTRAVA